jgi:hypothetical protein
MFERPITWRFTEYSAVIIRMPERRSVTPSRVWRDAVTYPASMPAPTAARVARRGGTSCTRSAAHTAAPSGKVPSGLMSAKRRTRAER